LAILQIPLGWLPLTWAAIGWVLFSILAIFAAMYLLRDSGYPLASLIFVLCGVYLNRAVLTTLRNGQLGASLLILLVVSLWLLSKRKDLWAGIGLAILLLKPTIGLPVVGLIVIFLVLKKRYRPIFYILITSVILIGISLIVQPGWVRSFLLLGSSKGGVVAAYTPTWWGIAGAICQRSVPCSTLLGAIGSVLLGICAMILLVRYHKIWDIWQAGACMTCFAILLTPYLWAYDQILLLYPVVWISMVWFRRGRRLVSILIPILYTLFGFTLLGIATRTGMDDVSVCSTLVVLAGLFWTFRQEKLEHEN
jgi:hypothetical protein